ncbi:MAG: hypothetical protein KKF39_07100 [Nanoarchaeota archaeon]|nr:hypothetical protein [Nanoarchaeota archaeon]MBU1136360.1 hypothetical protein [Nanoarchaeota archaeon]
MKKKIIISLVFLVVILIILVLGYFLFFSSKKCSDYSCFEEHLKKCKKASYVDETEDGFWEYKINKKEQENCKVNVRLLQLKKGNSELSLLEGKNMECDIELGTASRPQNNLKICNGLLKEKMQEIIIERLHKYVTENLEDIKKVFSS